MELKERWILSRFYQTLESVGRHLDNYKINEAAKLIYEFFWHEFCDWYLELAKSTFLNDNTQVVLYKVLEKSLRMLHPFMPHITEEIWQAIPHEGDSIMISSWPHVQKQIIDKRSDADMALIIEAITSIRNIRATWQIEPKRFINVYIKAKSSRMRNGLEKNQEYIKRLARTEDLRIARTLAKPKNSAVGICNDAEIFIPLQGVIDYDREKSRLTKKLEESKHRLKSLSVKLGNKKFLQGAPKEVIEKFKFTRTELSDQIKKLRANLESIE